MSRVKWAWAFLAALPFLAGCSGFWNAPTTTTNTLTTTTLSSGSFYVLNVETAQIVSYYVNAGTLSTIGSTITVPATPIALTVSPSNNFLYVSTLNGIYVYSIASNGKLTIANSGSVISTDQAYTLQVDSTSGWLLEAVSGVAAVYAIPVSATTGLPTSTTAQYTNLSGTNIQQLAIAGDSSYVFVAMGTGGTAIIPFTASSSTPFGSVSTIALSSSSGSALSVAVDPTERLFYIGETAALSSTNSGAIRAFKLSTLKEITGSPFASQGLAPYSILPLASGSYVYVANRTVSGSSTGNIAGFSLASSGTTYTLTALGSTFSAGKYPVSLVQDSTHQFVFVANYGGSYDLMGYVFDSTNAGYLDTVVETATGTDPVQAYALAAIH